VLTDGVDALLYDPSNPKSLASHILKLVQNKGLGKRISNRAFEEVCLKYSYEVKAKKIVEIIKKYP